MLWLGLLPGLVAGIAPSAVPFLGPSGARPGARGSVQKFAFPLVRWARAHCDPGSYDGGFEEEADAMREVSRALQRLENASGHLHWRFARTGWLVGSISPEHLGSELQNFVSKGMLGDVGIPMWQGLCKQALSQIRAFYSAWKQMLQAVKLQAQGGQTTNYVDTMWISASALTTYFLRKDAEQPTYLQEQQLAILLRAAVAINSGASGSPCTCQLFYFSLLRESVKFWSMYFSSEHTQLGPSGDPARDYYMDAIDSPQSPCSLIQESKAFLVPWQFLVLPETDQLLGDSACLPKRIVTAMVCGQYWLHKGDAKMSAALFHSASQMLVMSMDCFDNAVSGLAHHQEASNAKWLRFQELFSYLSQVDPAASPFLRPEGEARRSAISHRVPLPRLLKVPAHHGMVALPPFCLLPNSSALHLRIQGVPAEQPLFFYDFSAAWSLRRVYALPSLGGGNYTGLKAVFIGLDVPAWTNLGHALDRLISAVFGTYRYAYKSGGMPEVLRLRDSLEVHLRFSEEDSRAAGFEVNQSKGVVRSAMLPWLTLLSSRPPRLLSELPAGQVNASALPWPLQAGWDAGACYSGGFWCSRTGPMTAPEMEVFRAVATEFPFWDSRSKQELLREVWGTPQSVASADPCLDMSSRSCLRVLIVQRGSLAQRSRTIANLEEALHWVEQGFPSSEVRLAIVQMERFTIGEEIALAELTDIFIGAYGSAMWWPVFMAPGACVMWLYPQNAKLDQITQQAFTTRLWTKSAGLEYNDLCDLRHVHLPGGSPPPGTPGEFSISVAEERADRLAFQRLDIFLNLVEFGHAFKEAVSEQSRRLRLLTEAVGQEAASTDKTGSLHLQHAPRRRQC